MKYLILVIALVFSKAAFADSLFNDDVCPFVETSAMSISSSFFEARSSIGLTCQNVKTLESATGYVKMILFPATVAIARNPAISLELAAAGLTYSNPAILSVMVVSAIGVMTVNMVLKRSLEECAQLATGVQRKPHQGA